MNVGVIGVGYIGYHHLRNLFRLRKEGFVDKLYACDIDESRLAVAEKFQAKFYKDYKELVEGADVDGVVISVPTKLHEEVSTYCIERGVNVLIEKPVAYALDSIDRIKACASKHRVKAMVGFVERFNPAVGFVKGMLSRGEAGEIVSISARRLGGPRLIDCGVIIDLAIHDIDVISYLTERKFEYAYALSIRRLPYVDAEDYALISLRIEGGIVGEIEASRLSPIKVRNLTINATKYLINVDYIKQDVTLIESPLREAKVRWEDFREFVEKFKPVERKPEIEKEEPLYLELKAFVESIEKNLEPRPSLDDAYRALKVALLSIESYKRNSPMRIT